MNEEILAELKKMTELLTEVLQHVKEIDESTGAIWQQLANK